MKPSGVLARVEASLIPTRLSSDLCPVAGGDGGDAGWIADQRVPCGAAGVDNGVVVVEDPVAELVLSQVLPDVRGGSVSRYSVSVPISGFSAG